MEWFLPDYSAVIIQKLQHLSPKTDFSFQWYVIVCLCTSLKTQGEGSRKPAVVLLTEVKRTGYTGADVQYLVNVCDCAFLQMCVKANTLWQADNIFHVISFDIIN